MGMEMVVHYLSWSRTHWSMVGGSFKSKGLVKVLLAEVAMEEPF